jgi:hypothetical protein
LIIHIHCCQVILCPLPRLCFSDSAFAVYGSLVFGVRPGGLGSTLPLVKLAGSVNLRLATGLEDL